MQIIDSYKKNKYIINKFYIEWHLFGSIKIKSIQNSIYPNKNKEYVMNCIHKIIYLGAK